MASSSTIRELAAYLGAGITAAASNFAARFAFSHVVSFEVAVALAYVVGMIVGFTLMRSYAFTSSRRPMSRQMLDYCWVNLLGVVQTVVTSSLMLRQVFPHFFSDADLLEPWAHLFGIAVPAVSSYFGHKWFTFR